MGGAVAAIEGAGFMQDEIEQSAYAYAKAVEDGEKTIVGDAPRTAPSPSRSSPSTPSWPGARPSAPAGSGPERDQDAVRAALDDVAAAARGNQNLLVPMKEALSLGPRLAR